MRPILLSGTVTYTGTLKGKKERTQTTETNTLICSIDPSFSRGTFPSTNGSVSHLDPLIKHEFLCYFYGRLINPKQTPHRKGANWNVGLNFIFAFGVKSTENNVDINTADVSAETLIEFVWPVVVMMTSFSPDAIESSFV